MTLRVLNTTTNDVKAAIGGRAFVRDSGLEKIVAEIIDDVRLRGDEAVLDNARRFDARDLKSLHLTDREEAFVDLPDHQVEAIATAAERIYRYHRTQAQQLLGVTPDASGLSGWRTDPGLSGGPVLPGPGSVGQRVRPLKSVGVYVPGGMATYPSSVLMNALPAVAAGVKRFVLATPARPDGTLAPAVIAACSETIQILKHGQFNVIKSGGAAAIAAMALGTESVERVDKVVGPGNRYVNEAKRQLWGQVGVDGYAGPSEVCVLADDTANVEFAIADLLTQVEHAPDNVGFLVTLSSETMAKLIEELERQISGAPRETTMRQALSANSLAIIARDLSEAIEVVNQIAPEHLTLSVADPEAVAERIENAGSIFLGEFTPESAGDYCLGPSHTLPTSGAARWQSPVNVLDFLKLQSIANLRSIDVDPLIHIVEAFGEMEGLPTHAAGATVRRQTW